MAIKQMKKILGTLISGALLFALIPVAAWAEMPSVKKAATGLESSEVINIDVPLCKETPATACSADDFETTKNAQISSAQSLRNERGLACLAEDGIGFKQVECSDWHSGALKDDDSLWMWGENGHGQLGTNKTDDELTPVKILDDVESFALGEYFSAAVKKDGSLWTWGANEHGQLGNGTTAISYSPIKVMDDVLQVSLGDGFIGVVKKDHSLWMWGANDFGQLGNGESWLSESARFHTVPLEVLDDVSQVSCGRLNTAVVKTDRSLWTWGAYDSIWGGGVISPSADPHRVLEDVKHVELCKAEHSYGAVILNDNTLWMWGKNSSGQLGIGDNNYEYSKPQFVMESVKEVTCGGLHTGALKMDGTLWMWGQDGFGVFGNGTREGSLSPVMVQSNVADIGVGWFHSSIVKTDGSLWGSGAYNSIGIGEDFGSTAEFVQVLGGRSQTPRCDISTSEVFLDGRNWRDVNEYAYTGSPITPVVQILHDKGQGSSASPLTESFDYTLSFIANTDVGTAQITITGCGQFYGTLVVFFKIVEPLEEDSFDELLVERVKAYTSQSEENAIGGILSNPNYSADRNWKRMTEWFNYKGFLDYREGIQYWQDTCPERAAYQYLVSDETYCANLFRDWINSDEGTAARAALYSSALILNAEFKDWSIDSLSNYMTMETPGIKKYKSMLLDFIQRDSVEFELYDRINEVSSFVDSAASVLKADEVRSIKKAIREAGSVSEINLALQNVLSGVLNRNGSVTLDIEDSMLGEALGVATDAIGIAFDAYENVAYFLNLELNFEKYKTYESFLREVSSSAYIPFELRVAALQVCDDFENSNKAMVEKASAQAADYMVDGALDLSGFSISTGGQAIAVLEVATVVSNLLVDVGGLVEKESAVEGYAYLARHFKHNLVQDHAKFRLEPSLANAKSFYRNYCLLYELRLAGEDAYISMSTIEGFLSRLTDFGLAEKKAVADETKNHLVQNCQFSFVESPLLSDDVDMVPYERKVIVACPVAVEIRDAGGNVVCSLEDGTAVDVTNVHGRFVCFYNAFERSWSKVAYLRDANSLGTLTLTAKDNGLVTCSVSCKQEATDGSIEAFVYSFDKRSMTKGSVLVADCTGDASPSAILIDPFGEQIPVEMVLVDPGQSVTSITSTKADVTLREGESDVLDVEVLPSNASDKSILWTSSEPSVVSVAGGTVKALGIGDATVTAKTLDGGYGRTFAVSAIADEPGDDPNAGGNVNSDADDPTDEFGSTSGTDGVDGTDEVDEVDAASEIDESEEIDETDGANESELYGIKGLLAKTGDFAWAGIALSGFLLAIGVILVVLSQRKSRHSKGRKE